MATLLLGVVLAVTAAPARAHDVAIGQSHVTQEGGVVRYELALDYEQLRIRVPQIGGGGVVDPVAALEAAQPRIGAYVLPRLEIAADGTACEGSLEDTGTAVHRDELFAVLTLAYRCEVEATHLALRYRVFFDEHSRARHTAHANLVDYRLTGQEGRFVFEPAVPLLEVGEPAGPARTAPVVVASASGALGVLVLAVVALHRRGSDGRSRGRRSLRRTGDPRSGGRATEDRGRPG